ncbi:hypothetical protein EVAR_19506_1 [Eumeta japonica]|uniref:Uncharacterized protein n=1 Tax=Eumeta variegata TaxID=151549 RepID=A0A4C1VCE7_EUMVA|nr:hypothetical protein EVAR_19506_1 [Eumeta japonica]
MVGHVPVCFNHTAHGIDVFAVRSGGWVTITKFVTEIDTTALKFCKPVINNRLVHGASYREVKSLINFRIKLARPLAQRLSLIKSLLGYIKPIRELIAISDSLRARIWDTSVGYEFSERVYCAGSRPEGASSFTTALGRPPELALIAELARARRAADRCFEYLREARPIRAPRPADNGRDYEINVGTVVTFHRSEAEVGAGDEMPWELKKYVSISAFRASGSGSSGRSRRYLQDKGPFVALQLHGGLA